MQTTTWLQAGEAARRLGVTSQCVRNWARSGRLRSQRTTDGTYLFADDDVEALRASTDDLDAPGADLLVWPAVLIKDREWSRLDTFDGAESGGWLVGVDLGDRLVIEEVHEEPDAARTGRTIDLDIRRGLELAANRPPGWRLLGDFHNHPPGANRMASPPDKDSWQRTARALGRLWVGIVVTETSSRSATETEVYLTSPAGETRWTSALRI